MQSNLPENGHTRPRSLMGRIQDTTRYWYKLSRPETEEHAIALLRASWVVAIICGVQGFFVGLPYNTHQPLAFAQICFVFLAFGLYLAYRISTRVAFKSSAFLLFVSASQIFGYATSAFKGNVWPWWAYAVAVYNLFLAIQMMRGTTSFEPLSD